MPYAHLFVTLGANLESIISQSGYVILFIFTILEGIPVIGIAVPGHISVIIAGFMAKIGTLDLGWVLAVSMTGAVLGDYIGFAIGRKYGPAFIERVRPFFFVTDAHIERARVLLSEHTGKAMIVGRFTPATRSLLPFLVGCGRAPAGRFWLFNLIGGASWTVLSVFAGYIFGAGYHTIAPYFGRFATIAVIAAVIIIWGYRFVNMRFHIFRRYELITLALNVISLWALFGTIDRLTDKAFKLGFDVWVNGAMDSFGRAHPFFILLAKAVSAVGGTVVLPAVGSLLGLWFLVRKKWRSAAVMLLSIGGTALMVGVLKEFFMLARPANAVVTLVNDPSFPSGHAAISAAFFVAAAYLFAPKISSWIKREIMIVVCALLVILIGLSRLILNVHWASDVIAGWALGVFISTASILFVRYAGTLVVRKKP
ncbi:MAG: hypothetical protein QOG91_218 [Candidatus Parcubacteria bacterium]|jgi:undecaprenyl-diphosphatase|nr:hypothetical protein [Candidatus Parcubacteria bacterium]